MRRTPTPAEARLWRILRGRRLAGFKFRRQVPIGRYIADFLNYEHRLIVEADGGQHSENAYDDQRTAWLNAQGFRVMRIWNRETLTEPERIAQAIYLALTDPSPRSLRESPFPARGEGWSAHAR